MLTPLLLIRMTMKIKESEKQSTRIKKLKATKTLELGVISIPVFKSLSRWSQFLIQNELVHMVAF